MGCPGDLLKERGQGSDPPGPPSTSMGLRIRQRRRLYQDLRYQAEKKLEPDPEKPRYILTEWGIGYRFINPDKPLTPVGSPA